jgi:hypothetical protein
MEPVGEPVGGVTPLIWVRECWVNPHKARRSCAGVLGAFLPLGRIVFSAPPPRLPGYLSRLSAFRPLPVREPRTL